MVISQEWDVKVGILVMQISLVNIFSSSLVVSSFAETDQTKYSLAV